jgi:very-short-patch-repair endonuclease
MNFNEALNQDCDGKNKIPASNIPNSSVLETDKGHQLSPEKRVTKKTPLTESQRKELLQLRDRLIDLSSGNRSIRLNRLDIKWTFDLSQLNAFGIDHANSIVERCLKGSSDITILPKPTEGNQEEWHRLDGKLNKLWRSTDEILKEKGLYDLYVGFPLISGVPKNSGVVIQAPIFLIPVHLERHMAARGSANWKLSRPKDQPIIFNKTLYFALSKLCNLKINEQLLEEEASDDFLGVTSFVSWATKLLNQYGIPCHVEGDIPNGPLRPLQEFTMKDLPATFSSGSLKIIQIAVLGHFPQSNSGIQKDYERLIECSQEEISNITCFLSEAFREVGGFPGIDGIGNGGDGVAETAGSSRGISNVQAEQFDPSGNGSTVDDRPEAENFYLLPSDSSQDKILMKLSRPQTEGLVVWGPPGTGKSQTIVNIIGDCLSRGKSVLFVSQKRAALDVVYKRLGILHLTNLTALVHDARNDRKSLYEQLEKILMGSEYLDDLARDPSSEIESITKTLKEVYGAYNDGQFGIILGKLYRELGSQTESLLNLGPHWKKAKHDLLDHDVELIRRYQKQREHLSSVRLVRERSSYLTIENHEKTDILSVLRSVAQSSELEVALATVRAMTDHPAFDASSTAASDPAFTKFVALLRLHRSRQDISEFFTVDYWRTLYRLHSYRQRANKVIHAAGQRCDLLFRRLFGANTARQMLENLESGHANLEELKAFSEIFDEQFDDIKTLDLIVKDLPENLLKVIAEIDRQLADGKKLGPDWGRLFKRSVLALWLHELEMKHPVITLLRSGQIDSLRERYRELLEEKRDYCANFLRKKLEASIWAPNGKDFGKRLLAQVTRARRIPSIRKLNEEFFSNSLFRELLPVWLVSPEAVSDVLPFQKGAFDVVIFDEASQCTVENALPAIFRAKQVVIAGDEKQLPPNRMFEKQVEETEDEMITGPATDEPSLLTLAKKTLKYESCMLEWHYRAEHEELVSFSNQAFYQGRIKIAPNVSPFIKGNHPAIAWHSVNGYWEDRTNRTEAEHVVALIRGYLSQQNAPTIGVITFNISQKELILDEIEKLQATDPDFAEMMSHDKQRALDEQLFVKNIENVQGDERQVIIFSVAYAPSHPGGRVNQWFGILNQKNGENRLNVAITRAIRKIDIVASIDPDQDLDVSQSQNDGPKYLKKYLSYAKAVANSNSERIDTILNEINPNINTRSDQKVLTPMSPLEEEILSELQKLNYDVHTQVGQSGFLIDLAIIDPKNPSRYLLGIECDGAMYHSSVSARERDVFRQKFLENRGWKIYRIWSSNWWANKQREMAKLQNYLSGLGR